MKRNEFIREIIGKSSTIFSKWAFFSHLEAIPNIVELGAMLNLDTEVANWALNQSLDAASSGVKKQLIEVLMRLTGYKK